MFLKILTTTLFFAAFCSSVKAAKVVSMKAASSQTTSESHSSSGSRMGHGQLMMDVSAMYVRDTKPDGASDTAGRFSLGGMFTDWLGLDFTGLMQARSKSYLVGIDARVCPVPWLFFKGGIGGYSKKQTNELTLTPLAGGGIQANITNDIYFVTEASYFQVDNRENIGFGAGLGFYF